jgi:hypothetical protein
MIGGARLVGATALAAAAIAAGTATTVRAEPIEAPQRAQLRHFGFFSTEPEGLPDTLFLGDCEGLNPDLAQKVEGIPGRRIFVIPGDGCMNLVNMGPVERPFPVLSGVSGNRAAIRHGMQTGGLAAGFGIVPDGAIAAKLSPTLTVPVIDGTFFIVRYRGLDVASLWTKARLVFGASAGSGPT